MEYLNELLTTLNEMSPYLILGFFISGLLHVYVPKNLYSRFLQRKGLGSVMWAAILGVPLPLCSCGVIPTAVSLKKEGASDGATVAFLVGTPQTGVDSILATYSLLGLPFAIIRPIASFFVGIFGGVLVDKFGDKAPSKKSTPQPKPAPTFNSYSTPTDDCCTSHCCCHNHDKVETHTNTPPKESFKDSFVRALKYGFVDMMHDFGKWLVIGLLIAAAITAFIPSEVFAVFKDYYILNILLILLISAPMYICATGSIPIALSLILKGVTPGAAFVLLLAGPATNVASLIILRKEIGTRKTAIYLASIIVGAVACALVIDFMLPPEWFTGLTPIHSCTGEHHSHENCTHGPVWWQTTTSAIFIALFAYSIIRRYVKKDKGCCCNH